MHFLTYNELTMFDYAGETRLSYHVGGNKLIISSEFREKPPSYYTFVGEITGDVKETLLRFLLEFLSFPGNFCGTPMYVQSQMINKQEFESVLKRAISIIQVRRDNAWKKKTAIIDICVNSGLDPEPAGHNDNAWLARCPTKGNHHIMISTTTDEWGCGYCKRKGGISELLEWLAESK